MKRLVIATFTGAMSMSATAFGGIVDVFSTTEVGSFAYERILSSGKSCIYDYENSSRRAILRTPVDVDCPVTVTDKDIYPEAHYARDKNHRWNDLYNKWYFDNYPHRITKGKETIWQIKL
jgi:hypothetical protein